MSDCTYCEVEKDCAYEYKPCDCVHQRKFKAKVIPIMGADKRAIRHLMRKAKGLEW